MPKRRLPIAGFVHGIARFAQSLNKRLAQRKKVFNNQDSHYGFNDIRSLAIAKGAMSPTRQYNYQANVISHFDITSPTVTLGQTPPAGRRKLHTDTLSMANGDRAAR